MFALDFPARRLFPWLVAVLMAAVVCCGPFTPALAQPTAETTTANAGRVQVRVEPGVSTDAESIVETYGTAITDGWPQFTALFGTEPAHPQFITFVATVDPARMTNMRWVNDFTWVTPDGSVSIVAAEPFLALTPIEAGNVLRNLVSRGFIQAAADGAMPPGLLDGVARYMETPVIARQARLGSLVQGLHQAGTLPGWDQIVAGTAPDITAEEQTANAYALVAFLTDRYGVAGLRDLVTGFAATPDWQANLGDAFGQAEADLAAAWNQFLPRWFASGWRDNAVSAFDLGRAETLFARGAYEAASAEAERSQRLFMDLDDQVGLSRVEGLLAQCAVGLQADNIMMQAQEALEASEYTNALALIGQADTLYALLPEEHRPAATIERYSQLATDGAAADVRLQEANAVADDWLSVISAREDAVAAGNTYSLLGNGEGVAAANGVVTDIDHRIQRMLLVLSALVIALSGWLGAWIWQRSPGRLKWRPRSHSPGVWRTNEGGD
jgi:hypothetical protein